MIRRPTQIALLVVVAAFAGPAIALADVPAGTWTITGIELNGTHIDANGTIGFTDAGFGATVGCNSIGGQASVDGNGILTFSGGLTSTLIGCPKDLTTAEDALMKILSGGPIDITGPQWSNAVGEIDVVPNDAGGAGGGAECIPPVAPGANPGNVTVPCGNGGNGGNGGSGSGSVDGTTQEIPPTDSLDPTTLLALGGIAILVIATIAVFIYLSPRRAAGGGEE